MWVEQGPLAVLAGVIRGAAPKELHTLFQETLERIHARYGRALEKFEGDTAPFVHLQPDLEQCLKSGYRSGQQRKLSPALAVVLLLAGAFGAWLAISSFLEGRRWSAYVNTLRAEPGLLVVAERTGWWTHSVAGLRDPLARDPFTLMAEAGLSPARVEPLGAVPGRGADLRASAGARHPDAADGRRAELRQWRAARARRGRCGVGEPGANGLEADPRGQRV